MSDNTLFWQRASTIMAAIRDGHNVYGPLIQITGLHRWQLYQLLDEMEERGIVTRTPGLHGTLRLTGEWASQGDYVQLVKRNGRGLVPYRQ